ncbi:MAG: cupredoxin domain-containing protein, partial [Terriglobales bacterium]
MQNKFLSRWSLLFGASALLLFSLPQSARAQQTWQAAVGAESPDMGLQASAFLPNEIWIHAGDSITWTFRTGEIHTLTFLTPGQIFPPAAPIPAPAFVVGCPGFSTSPATYDGSTCVTTPTLVKGATFTVAFPKAGVYKISCLVHNTMTGTVYVVPASKLLPHDQAFYNRKASAQARALLADAGDSMSRHMRGDRDHDGDHDGDDAMTALLLPANKQVVAGVGEVSLTPGGMQTGSVVR